MIDRRAELLRPWRARVDPARLVAILCTQHRGRAQRAKIKHLVMQVFGVIWQHGGAPDVAMREALAALRDEGAPIGSESGPDGGVWWIADEGERAMVLRQLEAQHRSLGQMIDVLRAAPLDGWTPRQARLL